MKAVDLFAGCGGLSAGLVEAGYGVVAAVELDPKASTVYAANHPNTRLVVGDIRKVAARRLMRELGMVPGELDLLAACPPCQGFSRIRTKNRRPVRDARNDLALELVRFVRAFRPRALMLENVPQFANDRRFKTLATTLGSLGYRLAFGVYDAADFGVPQRRKRLILKAVRTRMDVLEALTLPRQTVRVAIGGLATHGESGDPLHDLPETRSAKVMRLIACIPKDGGSRSSLPPSEVLPCHRTVDGFSDVYGRMKWDAPAPTITSGCGNPSKGRFLHPQEDRTITLREAALLQGFPRSYNFATSLGREALAAMIGNALPPPLIRQHALAIAQTLQRGTHASGNADHQASRW